MWLGAPGEWQVGAIAFGVAGPNSSDFSSLTIEIAATDSDQSPDLVWIDVLLGTLRPGFDVDLHLTYFRI